MEPITWENLPDTPDTYAHGKKIHAGMRFLNYDFVEDEVVAPDPWHNPAEPIWFKCKSGKIFDASRFIKLL